MSHTLKIFALAATQDLGHRVARALDVIAKYRGESHEAERVEGEQGSRWGTLEAEILPDRFHRRGAVAA